MAEEKISYLEPIDDIETKKNISPRESQKSSTEKIVTPEFQAEKAIDNKSENESMYKKLLASLPRTTTPTDDNSVNQDADVISSQIDADSKVTQLVDLAVTRGVAHAIKVALRLNDFYVLDKMHDDLANKFHASLKEKGLIKTL